MSQSTTRIDAPTLDDWLRDQRDVRILDVRSPAEFETAHIPGAYNVPLDTLGEHAPEIQRHVEETVVVVCRSGMRASQAERQLAGAGMDNVKVLDGGMIAWEQTCGEDRQRINRGVARWDLERQVRLVAGSVVFAAIVASIWAPIMRFVAGALGLGLGVAAVTNTCAMGMLLSKLPYNRGSSCDVDQVVAQLTSGRPAART